MKQYLQNKKFLAIIFFVILILVIFHYIGILRPFENMIVAVTQPIQTKVYQISANIRSFYDDWNNQKILREELEFLRKQVNENIVDKSKLKILEEENEFLRQQLNFVTENDLELVLADVLSEEDTDDSQNLILNKGQKSGVEVGMPVVVEENFIVGKVIAVHDYFSVVKLINDHNSQIAVSVLNNDKTIGLVRGEFGLGVKMELVPQNENLNENDIIITSGLEEKIPRGLIVGQVEKVMGQEEDIFKEASVILPVNFEKIYQVSVLIFEKNVSENN